jgi:hypothetical protein
MYPHDKKVQSGYIADRKRTTNKAMSSMLEICKRKTNDTWPGYLSHHTKMHKI